MEYEIRRAFATGVPTAQATERRLKVDKGYAEHHGGGFKGKNAKKW